MEASILWRRLDTPGHDVCRLLKHTRGWELEGSVVFLMDGAPARLIYRVACDRAWRTRCGHVDGWIGRKAFEVAIERTTSGVWTLDGAAVPGLEGCADLDLGFSPATNLLPLRRLALTEGQSANAPAAWLDVSAGTLERLDQRYERRSETTYWYEAPSVPYAALMEVAPSGFIRRYPELWEAES